jgi:UDP-glucose 4-epimerase
MKTILITGASGMIGTAMTEVLLAKGYNVIGTDKDPSVFIGKPNFSFVQANIEDKDKITGIITGSKIDALVHLACSVDNDFPSIISSAQEKISANVDKYLFKVAAESIPDIMVLSTHQIYAEIKTREPIRETAPEKPTTDYAKLKYESEKAFSKALQKSNSKGIVMRVCPIYTKNFVDNLHSKIYDPKDGSCFIYGTGEYGFSFCCLYNIVDFVLGILNVSAGITYHGIYNLCDTKSITAKEIVEFERQFHKLGAVIQKTYGADAIKSAISFGSKSAKVDYRYNDLNIITSNICYDNTKAQRISTFRWKLSNTR